MSYLLFVDGYNVAQPIRPSRSPDPRWLERTRKRLLDDLSTHLPSAVRAKTCVVFDAANPPPDRSHTAVHQEILVRYAVGYNSADDLIAEMIRQHHTPKRLMVVSSDHRVQIAASRRGARSYDSEPWMDDLTDGKLHLAIDPESISPQGESDPGGGGDLGGAGQGGRRSGQGGRRSGQGGRVPGGSQTEGEPQKPRVQSDEEVSDWMREFGFDGE